MHIIIGFIIIGIGVIVVIKSEALLNNFGRIGFFERYLGLEGGSRLGYKLLGVLIIFIGFLILTNMINGFLGFILSPLFKYSRME